MVKMLELKGMTAVINRWSRTNKRIGRRAALGLKAGAKLLYDKSQEIVPVDKGPLKKSGYFINIGKRSGFGAVYAIGYRASYAAAVHEITSAAHGRAYNIKYAKQIVQRRKGFHARGSEQQAKFLSDPARKYRRQILKLIAKTAKI